MATITSAPASRRAPRTADPGAKRGPILVATDGSTSSDVAFSAARLLEARTGLRVSVLSVLDRMPAILPSPDGIAPPPDPNIIRVELQADLVRRQLRQTAGENSDWSVEVKLGRPVSEIALAAKASNAELIVTGLNRHGVLERLLGNETPLNVVQLGDTPLLATAASFRELPRHVLIAVDLDSPGIDQLRNAPALRALFAEVQSVYFIHVVPDTETWGPDGAYWDHHYGEAVHHAFEYARQVLALPSRIPVRLITPNGEPARQILDFTAFAKIDLIVAGRRSAAALQRRLVGGIAGKLLRGATCSVLLLPQRETFADIDPATQNYGSTETLIDRERWVGRLAEFSRRNAGRRLALEVDDVHLGAQIQASAWPLAGVDYDHRDGCVEIMLGSIGGGTRRFTHNIPAATSIDILVAATGTDSALRIAYDGGQVVLTFAD